MSHLLLSAGAPHRRGRRFAGTECEYWTGADRSRDGTSGCLEADGDREASRGLMCSYGKSCRGLRALWSSGEGW